ncbi:MAG: helix-hairpin-helix domain-containing protein [bacterium]|nr:helix-hairpin-helix domain-containing protein [bacterium]
MVKISISQKKAITLLIVFFLGLYIGYFFGKTRQWQKISQEENQIKAKSKNSCEVRNINSEKVKFAKNIPSKNINTHKVTQSNLRLHGTEEIAKKTKSTAIKININVAKINELTKLPGVGKKIAQNIIDYRNQNGPFKDIKDLLKVKRIGPKTLDRIQGMIILKDK